LSRALDIKLAEKADLNRKSDDELSRNKSLQANLYDLENKCRVTDDSLAGARREQDDLRFANGSLNDRNGDL